MQTGRGSIPAVLVMGLLVTGSFFPAQARIDVLSVRVEQGRLVFGGAAGESWTLTDGVYWNKKGDRFTARRGALVDWHPAGQSKHHKVIAVNVEEATKLLLTIDGIDGERPLPDGKWKKFSPNPSEIRVRRGKIVGLAGFGTFGLPPEAAQAEDAMDWADCVQSVSGSQQPLKVGTGVRPPEKIHAPQPGYTRDARAARIQGVVMLEVLIDKQGSVRCVDILKGLPKGLSESAARSVKNWGFKPATLNGEPVPVRHNLTVNFRLQ